MSRTGETLVDIPEATVRVLADRPELVLTYMRSRNEGGPGRHLHRQHADGDFEPEMAPERPGEVQHIALDYTRAREELGYEPKVGLEEGLEITLQAVRAQA